MATNYTVDQLRLMTVAQLNNLAAAQFAAFTAAQVQALSAAQLNGLTKTNFDALDVAYFTTAQLIGLSATTLGYLTSVQIGQLTTAEVASLGVTQLNALSASQFAGFSAAQVQALSVTQLNGLSKANFDALNVGNLTASQLTGLSSTALGYVTTTQIAQMTTSEISHLSAAQLNALSSADLAALSKTQVQALSTTQIAGMTATAFGSLALANLTQAQLGGINAAEMASIITANFDKYIAPNLSSIGAAGMSGISLAQIQSMTAAQINGLSTTAVAALTGSTASFAKDYRAVFAELTSVETGGTLTFAGAQTLLQAEAVGGMTAGKFAALQAIANALNTTGGASTSAEVQQLFDDVVLGNAANRTWTAGAASSVALGNLTASSSATQVNELIGKWFLGTDDPSLAGTFSGASYQATSGSLFGNGMLSYSQVNQGDVGDCYFVSALAGLAQQDPSLIQNMITVNSNGTYTVDFAGANGVRDYVTVNSDLAYLPSGYHYASGSSMLFDNGGSSGDLWSSIIEKAYVEFREQQSGVNSYSSISGGWDNGLSDLTGQSVQDYYTSGSSTAQQNSLLQTIQNALTNHEVVLMNDNSSNSALHLVGDHMYDVLSVNVAAGTVTLDNPWNSNGASGGTGMVFTDSIASLASAGCDFHVALGTARTA